MGESSRISAQSAQGHRVGDCSALRGHKAPLPAGVAQEPRVGRTVSLPAGAVKTEARFLLLAVPPCGSGRISPTADDTITSSLRAHIPLLSVSSCRASFPDGVLAILPILRVYSG